MCKDVLVELPLVALTAKHEKERRGEERRGWGGEREGIVFDGSEEVEDDYT